MPRTVLPEDRKGNKILARFNDDTYGWIQEESRKKGQSMSDIIREGVENLKSKQDSVPIDPASESQG